MVAMSRDTIACLANEADARASGVVDIWAKVEWRYIAAAYRELAQFEPGRTTNAAEQLEVPMRRAMDDPLSKAKLYLEQAERVRNLGLKEGHAKKRDNLLALAENYFLLHDRFMLLDRLHRSDLLHSDGETVVHLAQPRRTTGINHSVAPPNRPEVLQRQWACRICMAVVSPDQLKRAIEYQYGGKATFVQDVPVHEERGGQVVWDGVVRVFELRGQPDGHFRAYAWSYERPNGKRRFVSVLHTPKVNSPREAVRAAIVGERRTGK
jgi:hypothetical protein